MLGDVIGAESDAIVLFDQLEPAFKEIGQRYTIVVEMVEHAELQRHGAPPNRWRPGSRRR